MNIDLSSYLKLLVIDDCPFEVNRTEFFIVRTFCFSKCHQLVDCFPTLSPAWSLFHWNPLNSYMFDCRFLRHEICKNKKNSNDQIPVISDKKSVTWHKWKIVVLYSISDIFNVMENAEDNSPIYICVFQVSVLNFLKNKLSIRNK